MRGATVLEGGCGKGEYVYLLTQAGYKCVGVDTAKNTVGEIRRAIPALDVRYGDVRKLDFPDNYFDGYWSLGVIEHFFSGFRSTLKEMARVIDPGGFLFITFPYMSPFRTIKAKLGLYPTRRFKKQPRRFYQFALDHNKVVAKIEKAGFRLVAQKPFDGFKGLKDEIKILAFFLDLIGKLTAKNIFFGGVRFIVDNIFVRFSGHIILLVFQRTSSNKE